MAVGARVRGLKLLSNDGAFFPEFANFVAGVAAPFDPTTLPLSSYWRLYSGTAPWHPAIGPDDYIAGVAPSAGTQNSKAVAVFNGTSQYLTTSAAVSDQLSGTAGTVAFLVKPGSLAAASGNAYTDRCLLSLPLRGDIALSLNATNGALFQAVDTGSNVNVTSRSTGIAAATWALVHARWDLTTIQIGTNAVWTAPVTLTAPGGISSANYASTNLQIMCDYVASIFLAGTLAEAFYSNTKLADSDLSNFKGYANLTYGLSL